MPGFPDGEFNRFINAIDKNLHSHPKKPLVKHLQGVWQIGQTLHAYLQLPLDETLLKLTTLSHDIGKADPDFQAYLMDADKHKGPNHAAPSAWWTLALASEIGMPLDQAFWGAEAVRRHHTQLEDYLENSLNYWNDDIAAIARSQNWKKIRKLLPGFTTDFDTRGLPRLEDLFWDLSEPPGLPKWLVSRLLYSLLIAADRMDAVGVEVIDFIPIPPIKIPDFDNKTNKVNQWRQNVQDAAFENAINIIRRPGVYSLTLPTGAGKTLTGLRIASDLIENFKLASLLYVLPFISIVQQTTQVVQGCFPQTIIQEDHSLKPLESDRYSKTWQQITNIFRYWHQPIVTTTMAQFWDALLAPQALRTINFHKLANSVILLDEPQTLPPRYWRAIGELLGFLADELKSYFILMTATQPQIRHHASVSKEIAPKVYHFPAIRHKYRIIDLEIKMTLEDLKELIRSEDLLDGDPRGLIVMNTKKSALKVYDLIYKMADSSLHENILFMSSWLTPYRRKRILKNLKSLEKVDSPRLLISTQVVEAGVDLDFNWVIRDMGPLDSIIQVAGRCNRHNRLRSLGRVFVVHLKDENNQRIYAEYIYDRVALEATREVLIETPEFDELAVPELINRYYQAIQDRLTPIDLMDKIRQGKWGEIGELHLYPTAPETQLQVIIEETNVVLDLITMLEKTSWNLENLAEKKEIMQQLNQYLIEVPAIMESDLFNISGTVVDSEPPLRRILGGQFLFLSKKLIFDPDRPEGHYLYHPVKGFIPPDKVQDMTFIL